MMIASAFRYFKKNKELILLAIFSCVIMAVIDGIIRPHYFIKSGCKIIVFLLAPLLYCFIKNNDYIKKIFIYNKRSMQFSLVCGLTIFSGILGGYFILRELLNLSAITGQLENQMAVNKENFLFVSLYITFVNSLLEEFFFRGFIFFALLKTNRLFAYVVSSFLFAIYHTAMMLGWFSIWLFILALIALFIGGCIFNFVDEKYHSIYPSWLTHLLANVAINIIGFFLFGIL